MPNYFMLIVGALQIGAFLTYWMREQYYLGLLMFFYAITNFILYLMGERGEL